MSDKLHDCKRGLATATSQDYNEWWRERERLTAENKQFRDALEEIEENATSAFEDGWCGDLAREALAALKPIRSY